MNTVYDDGTVRLIHADCLDAMPMLTDCVDAVIADLPYATTKNTWDRPIDPKALWHLYNALTGERTPILLFGSGIFTARMMVSNDSAWAYNLVWDKQAVTGHLNAGRQPLRAHEDIMVFYRKQPHYDPQMVYTGRTSHSRGSKTERTTNHYGSHVNTPVKDQNGYQHPRSILSFKRPKSGKHPTQKPVALLEWMIRSYTQPGDLILDNVSGVASTLVAARNCGRRAIGIEVREDYIETSVERLRSGSEGDTWR